MSITLFFLRIDPAPVRVGHQKKKGNEEEERKSATQRRRRKGKKKKTPPENFSPRLQADLLDPSAWRKLTRSHPPMAPSGVVIPPTPKEQGPPWLQPCDPCGLPLAGRASMQRCARLEPCAKCMWRTSLPLRVGCQLAQGHSAWKYCNHRLTVPSEVVAPVLVYFRAAAVS